MPKVGGKMNPAIWGLRFWISGVEFGGAGAEVHPHRGRKTLELRLVGHLYPLLFTSAFTSTSPPSWNSVGDPMA